MRKILIFSDSHGKLSEMQRIISENPDCECILHAGDYANDIRRIERGSIPFYAVAGNCDSYSGTVCDSEYEVIRFGKSTFFLTHGHTFNVKYAGLDALVMAASQNGCNVAVYGHTHIPDKQIVNNILVVNPGSISAHRSEFYPSYAEVILEDDGEIARVFVKNTEE